MSFVKTGIKAAVCALTCVSLCACGTQDTDPTTKKVSEIFSIANLHNGDAKFFGDDILTSVNGTLTRIDPDTGDQRTYSAIASNWIDGISDENLMVYGNNNKETGLAIFDENKNVVRHETLFTSDHLMIDPTISHFSDFYFLTYTDIEGTVNNADPNAENGIYTIKAYRSSDLQNWTALQDITSQQHNLEDVDVISDNGRIYISYEKETVDRGNSALEVRYSDDNGQTWSDEIDAVPCDADHEPASLVKINGKFRLYYSCDEDDPGASYMGGKIYFRDYDRDFQPVSAEQRVDADTEEGLLLYDIKQSDDGTEYLCAGDYLTTCDLLLFA